MRLGISLLVLGSSVVWQGMYASGPEWEGGGGGGQINSKDLILWCPMNKEEINCLFFQSERSCHL